MEYITQSQVFVNCVDAMRFMQLRKRAVMNPKIEASYSELKELADDFIYLSWQFNKYPTKNYEGYPKMALSYAKIALGEMASRTSMNSEDREAFIKLYINNFDVRSIIR